MGGYGWLWGGNRGLRVATSWLWGGYGWLRVVMGG